MERNWIETDGELRDSFIINHDEMRVVMDECKALRDSGQVGTPNMRHLMRVPAELVEKYLIDNGVTFAEWCSNPEHANRMVNDPTLARFRVWQL